MKCIIQYKIGESPWEDYQADDNTTIVFESASHAAKVIDILKSKYYYASKYIEDITSPSEYRVLGIVEQVLKEVAGD